jgi:hypothetical protein
MESKRDIKKKPIEVNLVKKTIFFNKLLQMIEKEAKKP